MSRETMSRCLWLWAIFDVVFYGTVYVAVWKASGEFTALAAAMALLGHWSHRVMLDIAQKRIKSLEAAAREEDRQ